MKKKHSEHESKTEEHHKKMHDHHEKKHKVKTAAKHHTKKKHDK